MQLTPSLLGDALVKARPLLTQMHLLYERLPDTRCECERPGQCCTFMPEMTMLEGLQWLEVLACLPERQRVTTLRRFLEFYLTTPVRSLGCPFRDAGGACSIYPFRTFACRAYGIWSQAVGRTRTRQNRAGRAELIRMWRRYGVELAPGDITEEMDYCQRVRVLGSGSVGDSWMLARLEQLYRLGQPIADLQRAFENDYHSDFSFLLATLLLPPRKAVLGKFSVVKEIVEKGGDIRLKKLLSRVGADSVILDPVPEPAQS